MSKNQQMGQLEFVESEVPLPAARSGRVIHDSRGNAMWDWTIETSVLNQTSVDELLGKLVDPVSLGLEHEPAHAANWCGDPYNRTC